MPTALVLRHHLEDEPGLIGQALRARGYTVALELVDPHWTPPDLAGVTALVILGSSSAVYDPLVRARWLDRELDLIATADRRGIAILGICFGAQALCTYAGGRVERAALPELGWISVDPAPGSPIEAGPWFVYHEDACILPPEAEVLATSPHAVQAFRLGRHLGVQFHPEVDAGQLAAWFAADSSAGRADARVPDLLAQAVEYGGPARRRAEGLVDTFLAGASRTPSTEGTRR
ncbi:MAG: type 1 glutamine amidotransferase [Acidimicrobiales bacterium]